MVVQHAPNTPRALYQRTHARVSSRAIDRAQVIARASEADEPRRRGQSPTVRRSAGRLELVARRIDQTHGLLEERCVVGAAHARPDSAVAEQLHELAESRCGLGSEDVADG